MAFTLPTTTKTFTNNINCSSTTSFKPLKLPLFWPWQKVKMGPLSISPMGFGTWAWGNQLLWGYQTSMDDQLQQAFELALQNGINLFDTADSYGTGRLNGQSERLLGQFIKQSHKASLDRLQIDQLGIGQLHWSTANYAPLQELALWDGLVAMYEKVALSLLFGQILPGLEPLLVALREIARKRGKTMPQVAINWCICKGTVPIPGIKSVRHVEDNLGAMGWRLTNDEQLQLEYAAQESPSKPKSARSTQMEGKSGESSETPVKQDQPSDAEEGKDEGDSDSEGTKDTHEEDDAA
ncbi:hypothetical protein Bca4012_010821 [Brassica carinata]